MSRVCFLSPPAFNRLDWACRPIAIAFKKPVYLVGSVMTRPDFRDIDLRLILSDKKFEKTIPNREVGLLLDIALSDLIAKAAQLPWQIDFQIQSQTEANEYPFMRNPLGVNILHRI